MVSNEQSSVSLGLSRNDFRYSQKTQMRSHSPFADGARGIVLKGAIVQAMTKNRRECVH